VRPQVRQLVRSELDVGYTLDFAEARFDEVELGFVTNKYGNRSRVLTVPGAKYCPAKGVDLVNAGATLGTCADRYNVGPVAPSSLEDKFRAHIDRIRGFCKALSFDRDPHRREVALR
jgi:hypothetical protein